MFATKFFDTHFVSLSKGYRHLRDYLRFKRFKPYQTQLGFKLLGDPALDTSRLNSHEVAVFTEHLENVDAFIDVGANVGLFTCLAACSKKKILSFEPHPYNQQCLYRNLLLNEFTGVEVFPIALSAQAGVYPLFGGGQGATLLEGWGNIQSNYQTLTPTNTLDNMLYERFRGQRLLIKIDVEGHEFPVLKGALSLLAETPAPTWMIEHGLTENFGAEVNPNFEALFEMFWQHGYKAQSIDSARRVVTRDDVKRWLTSRTRDFGGIDFLFTRG